MFCKIDGIFGQEDSRVGVLGFVVFTEERSESAGFINKDVSVDSEVFEISVVARFTFIL